LNTASSIPGYRDPQRALDERVDDLLARMTLDEKIAQLGSAWVYELLAEGRLSLEKARTLCANGIGQITRIGGASSLQPPDLARLANEIQAFLRDQTRLGIPALVHEEACSGYLARGATCFPQTIGAASTWEPELIEAMGRTIRTQMRAVGGHQALAPLMDVTRDPRWGRAEETFGEDPYLVARMSTAFVQGLQGAAVADGVIATAKHFVAYGASEGGMNWAPPHLSPRELQEVFLFPFEAAVKTAGLKSVMNAYNELDGVPCGASVELLKTILRDQWGFDGLVVSDYFAVPMLESYHHIAATKAEAAHLALKAGIDLELPGTDCYGAPLRAAVEAGDVPAALVDQTVRRVLAMKFRMGLFEQPFVPIGSVTEVFDSPSQRELAREMARKAIVLLKNAGDRLPLSKTLTSIAVIGPNADNVRHQMGDYSYPAHVESLMELIDQPGLLPQTLPDKVELADIGVKMVSVLDGIKAKLGPQATVHYTHGCEVLGTSQNGFAEAIAAACAAEVAIVVVGDKAGLTDSCSTGESRDRAELGLPGVQQQLVEAIAATGTPTVLVLMNGRPLALPWIAEHIPAVLEVWLPGEEGGNAVADILFGDACPGGKLPISFPRAVGQVPVYYNHKPSGGRSHWKGDYIDLSTQPLYPFGYGLSYTRFEYANLRFDQAEIGPVGQVAISIDITNCGSRLGDEVVQLYLHDPAASVTRPVKELKGFKRLDLAPGETKTVTFRIDARQLGFYNPEMDYVVEPGVIEVMVGSSSQDIRARGEFQIVGQTTDISRDKVFFSAAFEKPRGS